MRKHIISTLLLLLSQLAMSQITVDADIPAGNIIYESMSNDTVYVHQDLRDTEGPWFYWAFRVRGAQGRKITFTFTESDAVGVRGAVVSTDKGKSYAYASEPGFDHKHFIYRFPAGASEVWFYECHPYMPENWNAFLSTLNASMYTKGILCKSLKGKDVPVAEFGKTSGKARYSILVSARHHCSESVVNYAIEGLVSAFTADDGLGRWLRKNVRLTVIPFTDYDGVCAGDQGKNRRPHDHNRDYTEFIYPETRAIASTLRKLQPVIYIDMHCPWLYGDNNEYIYTPLKDPKETHDMPSEIRYSKLLEENQEGGLRYKASDDLPFGVSWNANANYSQGLPCILWAYRNIPSLRVCRSTEVPFANANGAEVNPERLRKFGHSIAKTFKAFLETMD